VANMFKERQVAQPDNFEFSAENKKKIKQIIAKYPKGKQRSAVMPLLHLAQEQQGWLPRAAMIHIANLLDMPEIQVFEVATFYTQYNKQPVGKHLIQVCGTTPCWLRGSEQIIKACKNKLKISPGETTDDEEFTLVQVECLGACVNAPVVQINNDYYEDLTPEAMEDLIDKLAKGKKTKTGSQIGRQCSAPSAKSKLKEEEKEEIID
jgi:NADH-quinone oxidoreductase E subunit